jgi:hypothetical protein
MISVSRPVDAFGCDDRAGGGAPGHLRIRSANGARDGGFAGHLDEAPL